MLAHTRNFDFSLALSRHLCCRTLLKTSSTPINNRSLERIGEKKYELHDSTFSLKKLRPVMRMVRDYHLQMTNDHNHYLIGVYDSMNDVKRTQKKRTKEKRR
jgi:hypothetical protein